MEQGKLKVELDTASTPKVVFDNYHETFNDGKWHTVVLTITTNKLIFNVDYRPMITTRLLKIVTGKLPTFINLLNIFALLICIPSL